MVTFLHGPDSYRRLKRLKEIIYDFKKKNPGVTLKRFDFEDKDLNLEISGFKEFMGTSSLFGGKKIAVLENISGAAVKLKPFLKNVKISGDLIVISEQKIPSSIGSFFKTVTQESYPELSGEELKKFIQSEAGSLGVSLTNEAVDFLIDNFSADTWKIATEIQKFKNLNGIIGVAELKKYGDYIFEENIFSFINSVIYKHNSQKKVAAIEKLLSQKEEPAKIFNILASCSLDPGLLQKMADYDIMVKSGRLDYEEILLDLALT